MANVTDKVAIIRNATYGNEVREGIASGIENINTEVVSTTGKQEILETVFNGLVINAGSDNAEIVVARGIEDSLPIRLNKFDSSLAQTVKQGYISNMVNMGQDVKTAMTGGSVAVVDVNAILTENVVAKAITPEKTSFFKVSSNLINQETVTLGKAVSSTDGSLIDNATYCVTDFIPVTPNTSYIINTSDRRGYYTKNKIFITSVSVAVGTFIIPMDAYYIRQTINTTSLALAQLNLGTTLLNFEPYYAYIPSTTIDTKNGTIAPEKTSFLKYSTNLYVEDGTTLNKVILSDGTISDNEGYKYSGYITVEPNIQYTFFGATNIAVYDKDKNFLSRITTGYALSTPVSYTTVLVAKACYIRCNVIKSNLRDILQINKGTALLDYEPYYLYIDNLKTDFTKEKQYYFVPEQLTGAYRAVDKIYNHFSDISILYDAYETLRLLYPEYITKTLLGNDSSGTYPIYKYVLKPLSLPEAILPKTLPKIVITAGVHGEEKPSTDALYHMINSICTEWKTNPILEYLRFNVEIIFIPSVNPWGLMHGGRHNSNAVDINRNYSEKWSLRTVGTQEYGGTAPFSEVETQYVKLMLDDNTDALFYSDLHSAGTGDVYRSLMYHVVAVGDYYNEDVEIVAKYHLEKMTREFIKNYGLPENEGFFGWIDRSTIGGIAPLYGLSLNIPSTSSESFYRLPNEELAYSSTTLKACSEWLTNWLITIIQQAIKIY